MTRRELIVMFSSAALLKGQNCNIATYPSNFTGPKIDAARAVTGFQRPFDFGPDPDTGAVPYNGTLGGLMFRDPASKSTYPNCPQVIHHPGMDINKGTGWADFYLPVYTSADGVVVYVRPLKTDINPKTNQAYGIGTNNPPSTSYTVGQWMAAKFSGLPAAVTNNTDPFLEFTGANSWVGVIIMHFYMGKIYYSLYGHVQQVDRTVAQVGKALCKGTQIAKIGTVGATVSHLHFEIRKPNHPHVANQNGFCENISDAYLTQYYYDPVRPTSQDPVSFVDSHPSYSILLTSEISQGALSDTRFGAATGTLQQQSQLPIAYQNLEVRMIPYAFSGNRTVQIYHFLDPANEQGRSASFWDPDSNSFKNLVMPKLD